MMNKKLPWIILTLFFGFGATVQAESRTVFKGRPLYVIQEFGFQRQSSGVGPDKAPMAEVVISEIGGKFYWASRENREMTKAVVGTPDAPIINYIAVDGAGYVRVMSPAWVKLMKTKIPDYELDYTEHMLQGLGSLTYYGKAK